MSDLFVQTILETVENVLSGKAFPVICKIKEYDSKTQRALMERTVLGLKDDGSSKARGDIPNVPVHFISLGRYVVGSAPTVGQSALCIFTGRSISDFKESGKVSKQKKDHLLNWNDGVAFVFDIAKGDTTDVDDFDDSLWIGARDGSAGFRLTADNKFAIGTSSADLVALVSDLSSKVDELASLVAALTTTGAGATGPVVSNPEPATLTAIGKFRTSLVSVKTKIDTLKAT